MYTEVTGKYTGNQFGRLISDDGLSANLFYDGTHAFKVFNSGYDKGEAFAEAHIMARVEQLSLPAAKVFQVLYVEDHWVIEMEYVGGPVMMARMIAAIEDNDIAQLDWEFAELARLQAAVHRADAGDLPSFKERLCRAISEKDALTQEQKQALLAQLRILPEGEHIVHGDFQPFNVLYQGKRPVVIDWATAGAGVPASDVARTYLNLSYPPIPALQAPHLELSERYFRAYSRETGMSFSEIEPWFPVMAGLSVGRDPIFTEHMQQYLL